MRVYRVNSELALQCLGNVDISSIREEIFRHFNPEDIKFMTSEYVFGNTYRIVGELGYYGEPQKYSTADRSLELTEICKPLVDWLNKIYPDHIPVLIQCATVPPKTSLKWHMDTYQYQNVSHKVHFPIVTNADATYQVYSNGGISRFNFEVGSAYEINNILPHRVVNDGDTHRIHVIIDFMPISEFERFKREEIEFYHELNATNKALEKKILSEMMYAGIKDNLTEPNLDEKSKLVKNYFQNPVFSSKFGIMGEAESRLYYTISSFSGAICIVPLERPSIDVLKKFVGETQRKGLKDIYFLDDPTIRECLGSYDLYKIDRIPKGELSNLDEVNEYLLCYLPVEHDSIVMKATLKNTLRMAT
jgi:hypothetical protein